MSTREYGKEFLALKLPSCPAALIDVSEDPFRPQPRLDRDREGGILVAEYLAQQGHI